jgi:hypothetical protein
VDGLKFGYDFVGECYWSPTIHRFVDSKTIWCSAENISPFKRPYPGHEYLEEWLLENCPGAKYKRLYNDGDSVLEIKFVDKHQALWFTMMSDVA